MYGFIVIEVQYTWEKQLLMYIGSAIGIGFFLNNEYRISENGKILSVHLYLNGFILWARECIGICQQSQIISENLC